MERETLLEREVSSKGSVYTDIDIASAEFAHHAPYTVALGDSVELDKVEDGAFIYQKC
ncbi:hypothetical protein ORD22_03095 [Sporosarcina sp. GW1-11]|nr:hypothetical protein [Sporosarcina sp. GW1-11]